MQKTILIVDDNPEVRGMIQAATEAADFRVLPADSGPRAIQLVREHDIQVAVVDQSMPEMTGMEVLRELKQTAPNIVRIIMTGYSDLELAIEAINEGEVYRFLRKPFPVEQLRGILEEALEEFQRKRQRDQLARWLESLRQQPEENFEKEMAQTAFFHVRRSDRVVSDANTAAEQLTGFSKAELLQMSLEEVFPELDGDTFWSEIEDGLTSYGIALTQIRIQEETGESTRYNITVLAAPGSKGAEGNEGLILTFTPEIQPTSAELNLYNYVLDLETHSAMKDKGLKFLYEMSKKVGTNQNFDDLVQTIFLDLKKIIDFDVGMLTTFQERETRAYILSDYVLDDSIIAMLKAEIHGHYSDLSVGTSQNPDPDIRITTWDGSQSASEGRPLAQPIEASVNLPLKAPEDQLVGMIYLGSCRQSSYTGEEVRLLYTFAQRIALVLHIIKNLFAFREVREMAIKDSLTGLYNRRFFKEQLKNELHRARRYHSTVSFLILDVDRFKRVNDNYGHLNGDEVLRELARLISSSARKIDIPVRYGGEEFVIILPETNAEGALVIAERLRNRIENHPFKLLPETAGEPPREIHVTISAGISYATASSDLTVDDLVEQGDKALYRAKENGRNCVVTYDQIQTAVS